jgi:DnaJ-class molecular chaperone
MTVIQRYRLVREDVEVPEGNLVCSRCKGAGMLSKYDEGIKSLAHSPELAAKRECSTCRGDGYVPIMVVR